MKFVYDTGSTRIRGEVGAVAGPEPVVGGPFFVTVFLQDKHTLSYTGTIDKIKGDTIYFSRGVATIPRQH